MGEASIAPKVAGALMIFAFVLLVGIMKPNEQKRAQPSVHTEVQDTKAHQKKSVELATSHSDVVIAREDKSLHATVWDCKPMLYTTGKHNKIDRPAHLRAASSVQWASDKRLVVMHDDMNFVATVDVEYLADPSKAASAKGDHVNIIGAHSVALPPGPGDLRMFQKSRGNKKFKLDLEGSIEVPAVYSPTGSRLIIAFGSGSLEPVRDNVIVLEHDVIHNENDIEPPFTEVPSKYWKEYTNATVKTERKGSTMAFAFQAAELYDVLRTSTEFAGSELNIEGAAFVPPTKSAPAAIRFFQRGNGAEKNGVSPKSATGEVPAEEFFAYLDDLLIANGEEAHFGHHKSGKLSVHNAVEYRLGTIGKVPLTFTGVARHLVGGGDVGEFVYIAGAEASPDTYHDGEVVGAALGALSAVTSKRARYALMKHPDGKPFLGKVEGIAPLPTNTRGLKDPQGFLTALDMDNPDIPSNLCYVTLEEK